MYCYRVGCSGVFRWVYCLFNFRTKAIFFRGVTIYCSNDQFNQSNIPRIDCQPYRFFYRSTLSPSVRNVTKNGIRQLYSIFLSSVKPHDLLQYPFLNPSFQRGRKASRLNRSIKTKFIVLKRINVH